MRPSASSKIPLATTFRPPGNAQVTVAATRSLPPTMFSTLALTPAPAQCSNMPLNMSLPCRIRGALGGLSRSIWTSSTSSA